MYKILLFENGRMCTQVGGDIKTLPDAIDQIKKTADTLGATESKDYLGYNFDRAGTPCAIIVADSWGFPIREASEKKEELV